jgi:hypothetical protein
VTAARLYEPADTAVTHPINGRTGFAHPTPLRKLEVGDRVPVVEALHARPVLLRLRTRGAQLRLLERDLAPQRPRQRPLEIVLPACRDRPIGKRDPDGRHRRAALWRLDEGGAKVEEVPPLPGILRAHDLSRLAIAQRELTIPNKPAGGGSPARGGGRESPAPSSGAAAQAATRARTGSAQRDRPTTRASSPPSTTTKSTEPSELDASDGSGRVCEPYG